MMIEQEVTLGVPDQAADRTLRDQFAMAALAGLMTMSHDAGGFPLDATARAKAAYRQADAMMAERSRTGEG